MAVRDEALCYPSISNARCKDIFLKISLLDKTFEILTEGMALGTPVFLVIMERAIVFRSGMERIMLLHF